MKMKKSQKKSEGSHESLCRGRTNIHTGQLRRWKNESLMFVVMRIGPDTSEPSYLLNEDEAEIQYLGHERLGAGRHLRQITSLLIDSDLVQEAN